MTTEPLPALPSSCWPCNVACVDDWDALTDPNNPDSAPVYTDDQKAMAVALAGNTLRYLTGYRIGGCPVTVRPCSPRTPPPTWHAYRNPGTWGSGTDTGWAPALTGDGDWLNIGCGCGGSCGCESVRSVRLIGVAGTVSQVKVDGSVLDPAAYRFDGGLLVRLDGGTWPLWQHLDAADTETGTWSVTYTPGAPVDGVAAWVAGILAGQYVKACTGGECDLPDTVTQIVRTGVTMVLTPGAFPDGKTGIREVDSWVETVNPYGLRAPAAVYSPDVHPPRVVG